MSIAHDIIHCTSNASHYVQNAVCKWHTMCLLFNYKHSVRLCGAWSDPLIQNCCWSAVAAISSGWYTAKLNIGGGFTQASIVGCWMDTVGEGSTHALLGPAVNTMHCDAQTWLPWTQWVWSLWWYNYVEVESWSSIGYWLPVMCQGGVEEGCCVLL